MCFVNQGLVMGCAFGNVSLDGWADVMKRPGLGMGVDSDLGWSMQ